MGSRLLEDTEGDKDTLNFCKNDYGYDNVKGAHNSDLYHPSTPVAFDTQSGTGADYAASFRMFENRQGGVEDKPENWRDLEGLIDNTEDVPEGYPDLYRYYQQIYKGTKMVKGMRQAARLPLISRSKEFIPKPAVALMRLCTPFIWEKTIIRIITYSETIITSIRYESMI